MTWDHVIDSSDKAQSQPFVKYYLNHNIPLKPPSWKNIFREKSPQARSLFLWKSYILTIYNMWTRLLYSQAFKCIVNNMIQTLLSLNGRENITFTSNSLSLTIQNLKIDWMNQNPRLISKSCCKKTDRRVV